MANLSKYQKAKGAVKRYGGSALGYGKDVGAKLLKEETSPTNLLIELAGNAAVTVATRKAMASEAFSKYVPVPLDVGVTLISVLGMAFTKKEKRRFARQAFRAGAHALTSRIAGSATSLKVVQGPDGSSRIEMG